jgi:hypothetical protein
MSSTTYVPIATQTLGSANANITFSSIPQTYTDLIVVFNGSSTGTAQYFMQVGNGSIDTGSNYSTTGMTGNGSSAVSLGYTNDSVGIRADLYATAGGNIKQTIFQIQNYSSTATNKSILVRSSLPVSESVACIGLWRSNSAINTLRLTTTSTFSTGATVSLYGIANADLASPKANGGSLTYDDTYWYHTFSSSGTFIANQSLTADILVVAGGGGGSNFSGGGGGGAGGLRAFASQSLSATSYAITVGAGGGSQANGGNSQFGGLTVATGGGASTTRGTAGNAGGSGGGGSSTSDGGGTIVAGGAASPSGQGNAGGSGRHLSGGYESGGGGGGAGAVGENGSSPTTGAGGNGLSTYSSYGLATGTGENIAGTVWYAGGGAGYNSPIGGNGGGGKAFNFRGTASANGRIMTGGGGASGQTSIFNGGAGGSGVVIIRYLKA